MKDLKYFSIFTSVPYFIHDFSLSRDEFDNFTFKAVY